MSKPAGNVQREGVYFSVRVTVRQHDTKQGNTIKPLLLSPGQHASTLHCGGLAARPEEHLLRNHEAPYLTHRPLRGWWAAAVPCQAVIWPCRLFTFCIEKFCTFFFFTINLHFHSNFPPSCSNPPHWSLFPSPPPGYQQPVQLPEGGPPAASGPGGPETGPLPGVRRSCSGAAGVCVRTRRSLARLHLVYSLFLHLFFRHRP